MRKKVYLHYESSESFTSMIWVQQDSLVKDVLAEFVRIIGTEQSTPMEVNKIDLTDMDNELIDDEVPLFDLVENKTDLFVVETKRVKKSTPEPKKVTAEPKRDTTKDNSKPSSLPRAHSLKSIQDNVSKRKLRKARELCEEVLKISPNDTTVLEYLSHVSLASGNNERAISCGERILQLQNNPGTLSNHLGVYLVLAQAHRENEDFEDAIEKAVECLQILEKSSASSSNKDIQTLELDLNAELTRSLFLMGRHGDAGNRINAVMTDSSFAARGLDTQSHVGCLLAYAEIAFQYDKVRFL